MRFLIFLFFCFISISSFSQVKDSLQLDSVYTNLLRPVTIKTSKYLADSSKNREAYKDIFGYHPQKINMGDNKWGRYIMAMGKKVALDPQKSLSIMDVNALAEVVHSKKKKQKLTLQKRLKNQEKENYVFQKFTIEFIEKYSDLHSKDSIIMFRSRYAPSVEQVKVMNELDLGIYIKSNTKLFRANQPLQNKGEEDFLLHLK
jgi:hypothetical protein